MAEMAAQLVGAMQSSLKVGENILHHDNLPFVALFGFRYLRLVTHVSSFWLYNPTPVPESPSYTSRDCTIVIPTVEPENPDLLECVHSVLKNCPAAVFIVTVGQRNLNKANEVVKPFREVYPDTKIQILLCPLVNKRQQIITAMSHVTTPITVLVDDHVFWPSKNHLRTILAPFEDPQIGVVGTNKRVRRVDPGFGLKSFWNLIGSIYLERHNFEIRATNAVDGGVFVISGRSAAHRTSILQDPRFESSFLNERFFFGLLGPLNVDDDNFITRWEVTHDWKIKIQYGQDAIIETNLGTYPKFLSQCLRWSRTTWRSNSATLFTERTAWRVQPWCVYAVYLTSFFNFALFYDSALIYTLSRTTFGKSITAILLMVAWIFLTKMVKLTSYFRRNPRDLIYLPGYLAFAYYHSFIKLYALLTFWDGTWCGRNLSAIADSASSENSKLLEGSVLQRKPPTQREKADKERY